MRARVHDGAFPRKPEDASDVLYAATQASDGGCHSGCADVRL